MTQFFDNSSKAANPQYKKFGEPKYPWKTVPVGKSFAVPRENIKFGVLRSLASKTGKQLGKRFRVVDHGEGTPYEVACLLMTETEAVQTSSNVVDALRKVKGGGMK